MIWQLTGINLYLPILTCLTVGVIMVHTLYETKYNIFQCILTWGLCFCALIISENVILKFVEVINYGTLTMILSFIFLAAYWFLFSDIPSQQKIFTFTFINNTMYIIFLFARTLTALFGKRLIEQTANQLFLTVFLITVTFFLTSFALEIRSVILKCLSVYKEKIDNLMLFSILNYVAIIMLTNGWQPWVLPDYWLFFKNSSILALQICGYMLAFSSLTYLGDKLVSESEVKIAKEQLVLSEKYYDGLVDNVRQMRMHNHNMRHITNAITGLTEKKDLDGLTSFVASLKTELPESLPVWSRVAEIDAVIASCEDSCNKENIDFQCEFMFPRNMGINTLHMCIMLGNCLQNALEACKRQKENEKRYIRLYCLPAGDKLILCVENSFDGVIEKGKDGSLVSRKEDDKELHGFGVSSIQSMAEKYHGNCTWEAHGNAFRMNVLLNQVK